jgi:hypothetical protein
VSPRQALELGLKVDMEAVPKNVATAIKAGKVDLNDPANTLLLLKANAVVGVNRLLQSRRRKAGYRQTTTAWRVTNLPDAGKARALRAHGRKTLSRSLLAGGDPMQFDQLNPAVKRKAEED